MDGDTDQAEAQAQVAAFLDPVELVQYEALLRRRGDERDTLKAQCRSMVDRIERDIIWRLDRGPEEAIYANPFTNGGYAFDEAIHRVRSTADQLELFRTLSSNRRSRAERAAVVHLASLFKGAKLFLPGRKHPYRPLK